MNHVNEDIFGWNEVNMDHSEYLRMVKEHWINLYNVPDEYQTEETYLAALYGICAIDFNDKKKNSKETILEAALLSSYIINNVKDLYLVAKVIPDEIVNLGILKTKNEKFKLLKDLKANIDMSDSTIESIKTEPHSRVIKAKL